MKLPVGDTKGEVYDMNGNSVAYISPNKMGSKPEGRANFYKTEGSEKFPYSHIGELPGHSKYFMYESPT